MKKEKRTKLSNRTRRARQDQVQEYVDRYHPHEGKVSVRISPSGTFASVRSAPAGRRKR